MKYIVARIKEGQPEGWPTMIRLSQERGGKRIPTASDHHPALISWEKSRREEKRLEGRRRLIWINVQCPGLIPFVSGRKTER